MTNPFLFGTPLLIITSATSTVPFLTATSIATTTTTTTTTAAAVALTTTAAAIATMHFL